MNRLRYCIIKLGLIDKFGYTAVHATIDVALLFALLWFCIDGLVKLFV
jgi:hypothetical protein